METMARKAASEEAHVNAEVEEPTAQMASSGAGDGTMLGPEAVAGATMAGQAGPTTDKQEGAPLGQEDTGDYGEAVSSPRAACDVEGSKGPHQGSQAWLEFGSSLGDHTAGPSRGGVASGLLGGSWALVLWGRHPSTVCRDAAFHLAREALGKLKAHHVKEHAVAEERVKLVQAWDRLHETVEWCCR